MALLNVYLAPDTHAAITREPADARPADWSDIRFWRGTLTAVIDGLYVIDYEPTEDKWAEHEIASEVWTSPHLFSFSVF